MTQLKLNLYWRINKSAIRRSLVLLGIGCAADSEEEKISTLWRTWVRPKGSRIWQEMKPQAGNL